MASCTYFPAHGQRLWYSMKPRLIPSSSLFSTSNLSKYNSKLMFCPSTEQTVQLNYIFLDVHSQSFNYWTCGSLQSGKKVPLSFQTIIDSENSPDYTLITRVISSNSTCRPSIRRTESPVVRIVLWFRCDD